MQNLQLDSTVAPFLKWPGGKRWLVSERPEWFTVYPGRHIEPFLGGAAAFFHVKPRSAILSDVNAELIATYEAIRDDPAGVLRHLRNHQKLHSHAYYYSVRKSVPRTDATRAARFVYLNRTCFNGIFRVNLKGEFNVPIGTKTNVLLPTDNFDTIAELLRPVNISARDFSLTIKTATEGDFVYIDPPYTVKHNNNNFVKYNESIFSWADQITLAERALRAAKRGAFVLVSNADHASIRELYSDLIWRQVTLKRFSKLAASSENRKLTTELVISNYLSKEGLIEAIRT